MRKLLLTSCVFLAVSCGSVTPWGNAKIPVTEIANRSSAIVTVLQAADLNKDGVIQGDAEWFALGSGAAQLFVAWAAELKTQ